MIVTEKEAKDRWCPFVQIGGRSPDQDNREYSCIAAECMAWKWVEEGSRAKRERIETPLVGEKAEEARMMGFQKIKVTENTILWEKNAGRTKIGTGYCGLTAGAGAASGAVAESITESKPKQQRPKATTEEPEILRNDRGEEFNLEEISRLAGTK